MPARGGTTWPLKLSWSTWLIFFWLFFSLHYFQISKFQTLTKKKHCRVAPHKMKPDFCCVECRWQHSIQRVAINEEATAFAFFLLFRIFHCIGLSVHHHHHHHEDNSYSSSLCNLFTREFSFGRSEIVASLSRCVVSSVKSLIYAYFVAFFLFIPPECGTNEYQYY